MQGRVKAETGAITGDHKLKYQIQKDRTAVKVKVKVEKEIDKLTDMTQ